MSLQCCWVLKWRQPSSQWSLSYVNSRSFSGLTLLPTPLQYFHMLWCLHALAICAGGSWSALVRPSQGPPAPLQGSHRQQLWYHQGQQVRLLRQAPPAADPSSCRLAARAGTSAGLPRIGEWLISCQPATWHILPVHATARAHHSLLPPVSLFAVPTSKDGTSCVMAPRFVAILRYLRRRCEEQLVLADGSNFFEATFTGEQQQEGTRPCSG
jgi:hypothetical protein